MIARQLCLCACLLLSSLASAAATPVIWSGNGHTYEVVSAPGITATQAQAACQARGGHLATINLIGEYDFVTGLLGGDLPYLGPCAVPTWLGPWYGGGQYLSACYWGDPSQSSGTYIDREYVGPNDWFPSGIRYGEANWLPAGAPPIPGYIYESNSCTSDFTFSVATGAPTVTFQGSPTTVTRWVWDFGDKTSTTGRTPTHTFPVPACRTQSYWVQLTTYDGNVQCSTKNKLVWVSNPAAPPGSLGTAYVIIGNNHVKNAEPDKQEEYDKTTEALVNATIARLQTTGYLVRTIGTITLGAPKIALTGVQGAFADPTARAFVFIGHGSYSPISGFFLGLTKEDPDDDPTAGIHGYEIEPWRASSGSSIQELRIYACETGLDPLLRTEWHVDPHAAPENIYAPPGDIAWNMPNKVEKGLRCGVGPEPRLTSMRQRDGLAGAQGGVGGGDGYVPMFLEKPDGTYGDSLYGTIAGLDQVVVIDGQGNGVFADPGAGVSGRFMGQSVGDSVEVWTNRYARMPADTMPPGIATVAGFLVSATCDAAGSQLTLSYDAGSVSDPEQLGVWRLDDSTRAYVRLVSVVDTSNHGVTVVTDRWGRFLMGLEAGVVPVEVSLVSAEAKVGSVRLTWLTAGGKVCSATVYRKDAGASWTRIGQIVADGAGKLAFEDTHVSPGTRYGYRLGARQGGEEAFFGETWVDVPNVADFSLVGATPNPIGQDLTVTFSLPDAASARLEVLDVAGRQVFARNVGALGPGKHVVRVADGRDLPAGVYVVRLARGQQALTARAVIIR